MKTSELMIGDWVLCDGKPYQIAEIGGMVCLDYENELFASLDDIEPIPLTPEILKKNGMREFEHRNPWQGENLIKKWYHKSGAYYVSLYQVEREQTYTFGDGFRPSRICNIRYVHELQHALRLCGIEKEIEL